MKGRWSWLLGAAALAMALGSGCTSASLVASIDAPATLKSTCVRVVALSGGAEITSKLVALPAATNPLVVAIFEPQGQSRPVTVLARGYVGRNGCDEPLLLNDESAPVDAQFKLGSGGSATLTLAPPPPALDGDGDGYRQAAAGGPDCDDRRASVHPGATEVCGDSADNDCDGLTDCEQLSCVNQACGNGRICTGTGACEGHENQCTNGIDDDLDGLIDCLDPDCDSVNCDDGNPCTTQDRCQAGQCTGTAVTCNASGGNACLASTGTCNPADGGCVYLPMAGQACGGGVCDHDGGCGPLYAYTPSNFTPPVASAFVSLRFDCGGTATIDTTPNNTAPFGGALCGQTVFPTIIDRAQTGAGSAAVIPVENLYVASNMDVVITGTRPAIFAVFGDAQIDGRLYPAWGTGASSHGMGVTTQCAAGVGAAGTTGTSGGGGGGGSYGGAGAGGGSGSASVGGGTGLVSGVASLSPLTGGCAGGAGGNPTPPGGGGGGGAVQISATETVVVRGAVGAPGGGGGGGAAHQTGGGGGGSGGAVLLEGRSVRVSPTGKVTANGGGGGEGDACCAAGTLDGAGGGVGSVDNANRAGGGNAGQTWSVGGNGGAGAAGTQPATVGGNGAQLSFPGGVNYQGGGGGGGGGLGRIRFNAARDCQLDGGLVSGSASSNGATGCP